MKLFHVAPRFELTDANGELVTRDHFAGRYLVLYFYPKANTSGCTREAQAFTARKRDFAHLDADIVGVSPDGLGALGKFIQSKALAIPLLSDPHGGVAEQFGALNNKGGILRSTFLIDRGGVVRWQWKGVNVNGHADEVYAVLEQLHAADEAVNPLLAVRRSRRALGGKITKGTIRRLVQAALLAPSCFNMQPWRFIAATGASLEAVHAGL
jgi:peroxiredoxin